MGKRTVIQLSLVSIAFGGLCWLWFNDAALNAVLTFATAGVVPGTDTVLTTEQTYWVLAGILVVSIGLTFHKALIRDVRAIGRLFRRRAATSNEELTVVEQEPEMQPVPPQSVTLKAAPSHTLIEPVVAPDATPQRVKPSWLIKQWRLVRPRLFVALGVSLTYAVRAVQVTARAGQEARLTLYGYGMRLWLQIEPYIRRFDSWLERTLKSNQDIAAVLHVGREIVKPIRTRVRQLRLRLMHTSRLPED